MSNKQQIETTLRKLLLDDNRAFVAMLSGKWGIGKTYFWREEFSKIYLKDKDVVYISLFGKNSLADITEEILTKLFKYKAFTKKYSKHLSTISGWISKYLGSPFHISAGSILSLFNPTDFKNTIICFDDFERLSGKVDLKDVMGLISQFKEQKECKVIMILNEKELDKLSDIDGKRYDEIFALFKEKIVDFTFHYQPSQKELFDIIKEDVDKIKFCEPQTIYDFFAKINLKNIRIMRQAVYQLGHYEFIKNYSFDKNVIDDFVYIALNLFVFKAKSNYDFDDFKDFRKYKSKVVGDYDPETGGRIEENSKHEKYINDYDTPPYQNTNDKLEQIIYLFLDSYRLQEDKVLEILNNNSEHKEIYQLREILFTLDNKLLYELFENKDLIVKEIYTILTENKKLIPRVIRIYDLHKYFSWIREMVPSLMDDAFTDEYILSYFDIKGATHNYTNDFHLTNYQEFIESHYPHLIHRLKDKIKNDIMSSIDFDTVLNLIGNVQTGYSSEDYNILNAIDTETYKQYIYKSGDFFYAVLEFLTDRCNEDFKPACTNIKKALKSLKEENESVAWKIEQALKKNEIMIEDEK